MEALKIWADRGHVVYYGHVQNVGWTGPYKNGDVVGTTGRSLRLEAIDVRITDFSTLNLPTAGGGAIQDVGADVSCTWGFPFGLKAATKHFGSAVWIGDPFYQVFGPDMGSFKTLKQSGTDGTTYDDGSVRIEFLRQVKASLLSIAKYPDHVLVAGAVSAVPYNACGGHLWVRVTIVGQYSPLQLGPPNEPPCTYSVSPAVQTIPASGGDERVEVTASAGYCMWSAQSNVDWIRFRMDNGVGTNTLEYSVLPNASGSTRSGTITVGNGQVIVVTQTSASSVRAWHLLLNASAGGVNAIIVDAAGDIYATTNGGIFKSRDAVTWASAEGDLASPLSGPLTSDPTTPGLIYAAGQDGVFKTTNGGINWQKTGLDIGGARIGNIVISPSDPRKLYISTSGASLQCSANGGTTWSKCAAGLFGGPSGPEFTSSIAVSPANGNIVYTTTWRGALFQSTDGGANWTVLDHSAIWGNGQIYVAPSNPNVLYTTNDEVSFGRGTVVKSTDGGRSWVDAGRPDGIASDAVQLAISPVDANVVYATTSKGLFRTVTGGGMWTLVFAPPNGRHALVPVAIDFNKSRLYTGSPFSGFYESLDGGKSWSQANEGMAAASVFGMETCMGNGATIYAAIDALGLVKTTDSGKSWSAIAMSQQPQDEALTTIACHPGDQSILLAAGYDSNGGKIWKTTDGGTTFSQTANGYSPGVIAYNPLSPETVTASIQDYQGGVLHSIDGGNSWTVPQFWYAYPGQYTFHPRLANIVLTTANQYTGAALDTVGVGHSGDSGVSWQFVTFGQGTFAATVLDQRDPTILYVAGRIDSEGTSGIYKFKLVYDGNNIISIIRIPGVFNSGLRTQDVHQLLCDKVSGRLYVATANGVYFSDDQANGWSSMNSGLPHLFVRTIALSPDGGLLYAGTNGGIYSIAIN